MQSLSAILLAIVLVLAGSSAKKADPDLAVNAGSYLIRVLQAAASYSSSTETAYTAAQVTLRSSPTSLSKAVTDLPAGTRVEILDTKTVLNNRWYRVRSGSFEGWVLETSLKNVTVSTLDKNQATTKEAANLYSTNSQSSRVLAQLAKGAQLSIKRTLESSGTQWVYATAKEYNVSGWVLVSQLNMPSVVENADLNPSETNGDYVPTYATMGIVTANQLNIRTAPGVNNERVGVYTSGQRVGIIETNSGWGRTARGWIALNYVYLDGQVGQNPMVGNVIADLLNVRSGPGSQYAATTTYKKGDRLLILEQVYSGSAYWGYTRYGWVCMNYIQPDFIPGTTTPIYGFGMVKDASLDIYSTAGGELAGVSPLAQGTIVPVYATAKVGDVLWGQLADGWIDLTNVDMRAIFGQGILPAPPVNPPVEPTEPTEPETTEPTEPETTEPTEPETTEPTEPETTEPTEPETTQPTEPTTTEPTEPTTTEATEPTTTEATEPATTVPTAER